MRLRVPWSQAVVWASLPGSQNPPGRTPIFLERRASATAVRVPLLPQWRRLDIPGPSKSGALCAALRAPWHSTTTFVHQSASSRFKVRL